jgi:iron-sulfur cluster repair protein YtfE (RIC family)
MSDIGKLRQEHAQLIGIVRKLAEVVSARSAPPPMLLFELRQELSSTLIAHLKSEDWVLYPKLLASSERDIAAAARSFSDEMGGLAGAYMAYVDRWTATSIMVDWAGYCADSRRIIEALTIRIERENRELYPMLEALDRAA